MPKSEVGNRRAEEVWGSADFFEDPEFAFSVEPGGETAKLVALVLPAEHSLHGQFEDARAHPALWDDVFVPHRPFGGQAELFGFVGGFKRFPTQVVDGGVPVRG